MRKFTLPTLGALLACASLASAADLFEQAPIDYSNAQPDNRVGLLQAALEKGEAKLEFDEQFGYLPAVLEKLGVAKESQLLVFSKTSFQRNAISPRTPRALYYTDDLYVGYCHNGDTLEISTADSKLGTVFYSLDQMKVDAPKLVRETHRCLQCHATSQTDDVPGHVVRSLFVDAGGMPLLGEGSTRVDSTTPIEKRWGGWYVTGTHGPQWHQGNQIIRNKAEPKPWNNEMGFNVVDLRGRFKTSNYLTPHSDLIALLVFEHQTYVHNLMTKANYTAQQALHYEAELNKALGEPATNRLESTTRRINNAAEALVRGLLFADDAAIRGPFVGVSGFAEEFASRGPRDSQGRSLREFDLQTRLFAYPCSYLIYTKAFDELPPEMLEAVARKMHDALLGPRGKRYEHITEEDRQAIGEILKETKPEFWAAVERE